MKSVIKCDLCGNEIEVYKSLEEALKAVNGKSCGNISSCCRGKRKAHTVIFGNMHEE